MEKKDNGFRKDKKDELIQSLTTEEKQLIKDRRELEERKTKNDNAYKLFMVSNQGYREYMSLHWGAKENCKKLLEIDNEILDMKKQIASDDIIRKHDNGVVLTKREMNIMISDYELTAERYLVLLRQALSELFTYVDVTRIDGSKYLTLEEYDETVKNYVSKLSETKYKLY